MRTLVAALLLGLSAPAATAGHPEPVSLAPIAHEAATLTVVGRDGRSAAYDAARLEQFRTYSMVTATPWRTEPATFSGVLLIDVLRRHGLDDEASVRVLAENDYSVVIERRLWTSMPILVATRVDGRAHSRRERGPIQLVISEESHRMHDFVAEKHFVWMVARIEPVD